ncbi:MAG: efflux RND transporter permease subunit [Leptolyngbyaceae cyanobacterium CSU_1_3]|nr:efflux RND transporter permease subunit [Leptolyngbyaceae cyanobacterium CSU_1_3]
MPNSSTRDRFNISRWAIAAPRITLGFWIAVTVAGVLALSSLKYALFPDIAFPVVVVNASAPLTTAIETERTLTQPIEQSLRSLQGLDKVNSSTYPSRSLVSASFKVGTSLEESTRLVQASVQSLTLPKDGKLEVIALNLNETAVVSYAIDSDMLNLGDLTKLVQSQVLPPLQAIPGVLKVSLLGDGATQTSTFDQKTFDQKTSNQSLTPPQNSLVRFNGKDVLAVQIIKRGDANTLEVVDAVAQEVKRLQSAQGLPNVRLTLATTQADYIREATRSTIASLLEAIALAVIVIFPFLKSWKATFISALAIPTSLVGTFIVMAMFGFNLETITLLALALVIGSVVDDAIVDVENISRHIDAGESPRQAALSATHEIGLPVTAATLTAVAVFLPIALMGGVIGQFFKPFGITVTAAMLISMLVARTLSPVLSLYLLRPHPARSSESTGAIWMRFAEGYRNLLAWSLTHRAIVVGIAILSLVAGVALIPLIPQGFIPKLDRGEFNIRYTSPLPTFSAQATQLPVSPLQESLKVATQLEDQVRKSPDVGTVLTIVGSREGAPNKGILHVKLKPDRATPTATLQDQFRDTLPKLEGVTTSVEDIPFVEAGNQKPLQLAIQGEDVQVLSQVAADLKAKVQTLPGFADVTVSGSRQEKGTIQTIDRKAGQRVAYISANLGKNLSLGEATEKLVAEAKPLLPPGVTINLGGDSATSSQIFQSFGTTLALSALCIVIVLVVLFRSWLDPIVVGLSLPLALVGAMLALLLTQSDFGMISLIGFVFLLGLTNKNAILIVDYINQLRREGLSRNEAILKAGPIRLRPILMTTAATILGMAPIALGLGAGAELRSPMAVAIAGGLVTSTLLSLLVVPVIYALLDDLKPPQAG